MVNINKLKILKKKKIHIFMLNNNRKKYIKKEPKINWFQFRYMHSFLNSMKYKSTEINIEVKHLSILAFRNNGPINFSQYNQNKKLGANIQDQTKNETNYKNLDNYFTEQQHPIVININNKVTILGNQSNCSKNINFNTYLKTFKWKNKFFEEKLNYLNNLKIQKFNADNYKILKQKEAILIKARNDIYNQNNQLKSLYNLPINNNNLLINNNIDHA